MRASVVRTKHWCFLSAPGHSPVQTRWGTALMEKALPCPSPWLLGMWTVWTSVFLSVHLGSHSWCPQSCPLPAVKVEDTNSTLGSKLHPPWVLSLQDSTYCSSPKSLPQLEARHQGKSTEPGIRRPVLQSTHTGVSWPTEIITPTLYTSVCRIS